MCVGGCGGGGDYGGAVVFIFAALFKILHI